MANSLRITTPLEDAADTLATAWVAAETQPPNHLLGLVNQFHRLAWQADHADGFAASKPFMAQQDQVFDRIKAAAMQIQRDHARIQAQIRRARNREMNKLPYGQACTYAIKLWEQGVRF